MKRSGAKGGRKSARKAQGLSRSKARNHPSVLPSTEIIQALTVERQKLIFALRGALHFYDRASGAIASEHGWTATDVLRIEEIRTLAAGHQPLATESSIPSVSRPVGGQTAPQATTRPANHEKRAQSAPRHEN